MTIHTKLIKSAAAYNIAESRMRDIMRSDPRYVSAPVTTPIRLQVASYSFVSQQYAFSFWITLESGEVNEVIRVEGSEV